MIMVIMMISWCPVLLAQEYLLDFSPENELVNKQS